MKPKRKLPSQRRLLDSKGEPNITSPDVIDRILRDVLGLTVDGYDENGEPIFKLPAKPIQLTKEQNALYDQFQAELQREQQRGQAEEN